MKRKPGIIACALLAGVLVGCGGEGAESFLDAQAMAQLRQMLTKEPRLPDGFTVRPERAWRIPFGPTDKNCQALLEPAGGRAPGHALTAQAAVSYHGDGLGEQAGVGLAKYANEEAQGHLDSLAKAMASCRSVHTPNGTDLHLQPLPVRDAGDEAVGARLLGRLNGYPYTMDVVLSRVGDTLVSVVHTGMNDVDAARTRKVVEAAISMVET